MCGIVTKAWDRPTNHSEVIHVSKFRSITLKVVLSGTAFVLGLVTGTSSDAQARPYGESAPECRLISEHLVTQARPNTPLTQKFSEYGNRSGSWVGGDSTYSVPLKDGRTAWLFSDTLLGTVVNDAVTPESRGFINQSIVIQQGDELVATVPSGARTAFDSMFATDDPNSWFWLGAGYQAPDGTLFIGLNQYRRFGSGLWDWGWDHTAIGVVNPKDWTVDRLTNVADNSGVQWTSWFERAEGKTYIYGVKDGGALKQAYVVRVAGHDISRVGKWRYWTGTGWSRDASSARPILDHVANEYSVTKFRDGYLLVTQDTAAAFSNDIVAYTSCSPIGPFVNKTHLFKTPETGLSGSYGDPNIYTYNAHVHPELSDDTRLTISYNVNTFDTEHAYDDVTIYRPRFWTITAA